MWCLLTKHVPWRAENFLTAAISFWRITLLYGVSNLVSSTNAGKWNVVKCYKISVTIKSLFRTSVQCVQLRRKFSSAVTRVKVMLCSACFINSSHFRTEITRAPLCRITTFRTFTKHNSPHWLNVCIFYCSISKFETCSWNDFRAVQNGGRLFSYEESVFSRETRKSVHIVASVAQKRYYSREWN